MEKRVNKMFENARVSLITGLSLFKQLSQIMKVKFFFGKFICLYKVSSLGYLGLN